ncbi:hypothetical protein TNCV_206151 [Trichonephila clavipes]|nr:hypothetical protein TNCV_206151 [Trichonephila clavipes]
MAVIRRGIDSTRFWKRSTGMTCQTLAKTVHNSVASLLQKSQRNAHPTSQYPTETCESCSCLAGKLHYRADNKSGYTVGGDHPTPLSTELH